MKNTTYVKKILLDVAQFCGFVVMMSCMPTIAQSADNHVGHEEDHVELSDSVARQLGVATRLAGARKLVVTELLYGKITPDPKQVSHITARYPGMISSVIPSLGDSVRQGDLLASVEANDSLQNYEIYAPIDGIIIDIHANPGEFAGDQVLLTIANYSNVWADLNVFPREAQFVRAGQNVEVRMNTLSINSVIRYLNPGSGMSPHVVAKVPVNSPDLDWTPGLMIEADVTIGEFDVPLALDRRAIQQVREQQVVFIKRGDIYQMQPVTLGRSDREFVEILSGLNLNDEYVVEGSYLLKADLEKSGVSHEH